MANINSASLLEDLRSSQTTVTDEIAAFSEAVTAIAHALDEANQAKDDITAEKLKALDEIQTRLYEAVSTIRAVAADALQPDLFSNPDDRGYSSG